MAFRGIKQRRRNLQAMNAHRYLLNDAIRNIHEAQRSLVLAGLGTSPSFYRLTTVRLTLERRVKRGVKPKTKGEK